MTVQKVNEAQNSDPNFGTSTTSITTLAPTNFCTPGSAFRVTVNCGANARPDHLQDPDNDPTGSLGFYKFLNEFFDSGTSSYIAQYYANGNVSTAKLLVTAVWLSAQTVKAIGYDEVTGQVPTGNPIGAAFGGQVQQTPGTGANGVTTGTFPTAALPGLILASAVDFTGNGNIAAGTGFTAGLSTWNFGAGQPLLRTESLRVTAGATQVATFTQATNGPTGTLAALFIEAGATPTQHIDAPNRPRPGRGPFSKGRFFVSDTTAFTTPLPSAALAATQAAVATMGGSLSAKLALSGPVAAKATNTGALSVAIALAGTIAAKATDLGSLSVSIAMAANSSAVAMNTGNLTSGSAAALVGLMAANARFGGTLSNAIALSGTLSAVATDAGTLGIALSLSGSVAAAAAFGGFLSSSSAAAFVGTVGAKASFGGSMSVAISLAGTIGAISINSASLANSIALGGKCFAVAGLSGNLSSGNATALSGTVGASATFGGNLSNGISISGSILAAATNSGGGIALAISLTASMNAVASMAGSLNAGGAPITSVDPMRLMAALDGGGRLILAMNSRDRLIS